MKGGGDCINDRPIPLTSKHTPCPACGGRDRFRVLPEYQETGHWFCGGGGNQQTGDGFALLNHAFNWDSYQQFAAVGALLGVAAPNAETRIALRQQAERYEAMMQAAKVLARRLVESYVWVSHG